jgi:predicted ATPase/DNA-binding CsgD family transcriptional regulator
VLVFEVILGPIEMETKAGPARPKLSRRELEVAALVAQGLTNREIAARLFISERTADGHLEHIREKLGVGTRAQVAAWHVEHGYAREPTTLSKLPVPATSFVGRSRDVAEVMQRLGTARLVTIRGAGGSGKTRLVLQVAMELIEQSNNRTGEQGYSTVCFVDLAPLAADASVEKAVFSALGGRDEAGQSAIETLAALMGHRRSLLLLDNCEHLVQQCAELVIKLLPLVPQLQLLATSREALRVAGEAVVDLGPMLDGDAVELFKERARLLAPALVDAADPQVLTSICEGLDNLPLAIELAASWVGLLPVEEIHARLDHRLSLLVRGSRSAAGRHQTLRAAIDWSHELLDPPQRKLFRRLSVFAGGFSLAAAEAVCAGAELERESILGRVADLASASLLSAGRGVNGEARYRMLEMVREYAAEHLMGSGEQDALRARHLGFYAGFAEAADEELHGREQLVWLDRLDQERGNLLTALDRSLRTDPQRGLKMAASLYWYWRIRGPFGEGPEWLTRLLESAPDAPLRVRAHGLEGAGRLAVHEANWTAARQYLRAAEHLWRELDEPAHLARTLVAIAMLNETWLLTGDSLDLRDPDPIPVLHEAIEVGRRAADHVSVGYALLWLAAPTGRADTHAGLEMVKESLDLSRKAGDEWMVAMSTLQMGHNTYAAGDWTRALDCYTQALQLYRGLKEPWGIAISLAFAARCELAAGRTDRARIAARESFLIPGALPQPVAFEVLAGVAAATGEYDRALRLHGAAAGIPTPDPRMTNELDAQAWISGARNVHDEMQIQRLWQQGLEMRLAEAAEYALELGQDGTTPVTATSVAPA